MADRPSLDDIFGTQPAPQAPAAADSKPSLDDIFGAPAAKPAEPVQFQDNSVPELDDSRPGFLEGVERGAATRVLGAGQLLNDVGVGQHIGVPSNEDLAGGIKQAEVEGKGTGLSGTAGELLGDPVNYIPLGKMVEGANIGAKTLAKIGAKQGALSGITAPTDDADAGLLKRAENTGVSTAVGAIAAPTMGWGLNKMLTKAPVSAGNLKIGTLDGDAPLLDAVQGVKSRYASEKGRETALWNQAKDAAAGTTLHGSAIFPEIKNNVESVLSEEGKSLSNDGMQPLKNLLDKLDNFKAPEPTGNAQPKIDPFSGQVIPQDTAPVPKYTGVPLGDLIAIRRGISKLAGTHEDGVLRNASGKALGEFDKALDDASQYAVMSGDEKAIDKFNKAREQSKSIFEKFGTGSGETNTFQKIITNNKLTNEQIIDAFGTTARGQGSTSQTIKRMLDNAGGAKAQVQQNLKDGYLYRAIRRATNNVDGEDIINPGRMRTEIDRIISGNRMQGLGKDTRDMIYSPEDIKNLNALKDSIKDGKSITGKITQLAASKIPMATGLIPSGAVGAGRVARSKVEGFINPPVSQVLDALRGKPMSYAAMLMGAQAGKPEPDQKASGGPVKTKVGFQLKNKDK